MRRSAPTEYSFLYFVELFLNTLMKLVELVWRKLIFNRDLLSMLWSITDSLRVRSNCRSINCETFFAPGFLVNKLPSTTTNHHTRIELTAKKVRVFKQHVTDWHRVRVVAFLMDEVLVFIDQIDDLGALLENFVDLLTFRLDQLHFVCEWNVWLRVKPKMGMLDQHAGLLSDLRDFFFSQLNIVWWVF
jgi:hypothetical protein